MHRKLKYKFAIGMLLFIAACTQDARWQSACGCAFNLSYDDLIEAKRVALTGDHDAIEALTWDYEANGFDDEDAMWDNRFKARTHFAQAAQAANRRAQELSLPLLESDTINEWRSKADAGELEFAERLARYFAMVRLADEAQLWKDRLPYARAYARKIEQMAASVRSATAARGWVARAPLIEESINLSRGRPFGEGWSPTTQPNEQLIGLIRTQYRLNKAQLSGAMCGYADLSERVEDEPWAGGAPIVSCEYARGRYSIAD